MSDKPILTYLATPFSHPDAGERHRRFVLACRYADQLMQGGLVVFAPIPHSFSIEVARPDKKIDDGQFWLAQDFPILDRCDALVVAQIDGWEQSEGVRAEIDRFGQRTGKGPVYWDVNNVPAYEIVSRVAECFDNAVAKESILAEATRITSTERQRDYGHPRENFAAIAGMWNAYLGAKKDRSVTPSDVAAMFVLTKMARQANAAKRDSWVDAAGYARCGAQCDGFEE